MRLRPLSRTEVRAIDVRAREDFGLETIVLMENAGNGAAEILRKRLPRDARVLVVCGPGNNGGDGGVVARRLDSWGFELRVVWIAKTEHLSHDALTQHTILEKAGIEQLDRPAGPHADEWTNWLAEAVWIVDGLLGTGLSRPVEGPLETAIKFLNASGRPILALDLPSGLDCDTGIPLGGAIQATLTTTFVAPKVGFAQAGSERYTGTVHIVEIGLPRKLLSLYQGTGIA